MIAPIPDHPDVSPSSPAAVSLKPSPTPPMRARPPRRRPTRSHLLLFLLSLYGIYYFLWPTLLIRPGSNKHVASRLGMVQIKPLPSAVIPQKGRNPDRRLVFVGDVHGMYDELMELLTAIDFSETTDHLVLSGDIVSKGPDSLKVLDYALHTGASCVRGNHDDRLLLAYASLASLPTSPATADLDATNSEAQKLARKLSKPQAEYLQSCPIMYTAEDMHILGNVVVVHGGVVHGVPLQAQSPWMCMNMRSVSRKWLVGSAEEMGAEGGRGGDEHWADLWNREEGKVPKGERRTVVYGHYAKRGLDIRPLTKGLDSDCARGGRLTALIIDGGKHKEEIVQVGCRKAV